VTSLRSASVYPALTLWSNAAAELWASSTVGAALAGPQQPSSFRARALYRSLT
jgi:hypothetical protein